MSLSYSVSNQITQITIFAVTKMLCICWNTLTRGGRSKMSPCCILFPSIRRTDRFTQLLKALAKLVRHGWALQTFATFILFSLQKIGEKEKLYFFFWSVSVQNLDEVSGLADKEGWIKIIDFLKFATDTELCKIEFQDRVFSKSNFGHDEEKKKEGKKEPKLKVFAFFILGANLSARVQFSKCEFEVESFSKKGNFGRLWGKEKRYNFDTV